MKLFYLKKIYRRYYKFIKKIKKVNCYQLNIFN